MIYRPSYYGKLDPNSEFLDFSKFGYLTFEMKYFKFDIYGTHVQVKNVIDQIILPDESIFYKSWGKERNCII